MTLAIEYAAKPRLEVRKERILARHRQYWELRRTVTVLTAHLKWKLLALRATPDSRELVEVMKSLSAELEAASDAAMAIWDELPGEVQELFTCAHGFYKGLFDLILVNAPSASAADVVREVDIVLSTRATEFVVLEKFLRLSRWHFVRRRALRALAAATAESRRNELTEDETNGGQ